MPSYLSRISLVFALGSCALGMGCQQEPTIKMYTVARTSAPRAPFPLDQIDQILVAIVPQDDKAWFFKLVGKKPAIERQKKAFTDFLTTVRLASSTDDTPSWELPAGWSEQGASKMRAATLLLPDADGELELAVSSLPLSAEWDDFLVPNVNRWLDQLQCRGRTKEEILKLAIQTPTADSTSTVFHLAGIKPLRPMAGNPHAGLGIALPPATASTTQSANSGAGSLQYEKPADWLPGKMSMMRKAAFLLPGGATAGEVTVTSFPAGGGQMSDVATNVQRWAGQVGMAPPTDEELEELTEPITIADIKGTYVELLSPPDAKQQIALFVAMLELEGQVWFFKMMGTSETVTGQRGVFRDFLGSVRFE